MRPGLYLRALRADAPPLTRSGINLLRRELPEQVLPDGGHYERSPVYHLIVLRDLLEVQAVSPHSWIGDAIRTDAGVRGRTRAPRRSARAVQRRGLDQAPRLELPEPQDGLVVFESSGFAVVREGPLWLAFRCGPFAPDFLPAHAHADALSFQFRSGRLPVPHPRSITRFPAQSRSSGSWVLSQRAFHSPIVS